MNSAALVMRSLAKSLSNQTLKSEVSERSGEPCLSREGVYRQPAAERHRKVVLGLDIYYPCVLSQRTASLFRREELVGFEEKRGRTAETLISCSPMPFEKWAGKSMGSLPLNVINMSAVDD
jgi:hypothetical protein